MHTLFIDYGAINHGMTDLIISYDNPFSCQYLIGLMQHSSASDIFAAHHNHSITLLLGFNAKTAMLHKKMYRLYRKMTIYGHFSI